MNSNAKRAGAIAAIGAYAISAFAGFGFVFGGARANAAANEGLSYFWLAVQRQSTALL